jgi:hypothetical protein
MPGLHFLDVWLKVLILVPQEMCRKYDVKVVKAFKSRIVSDRGLHYNLSNQAFCDLSSCLGSESVQM